MKSIQSLLSNFYSEIASIKDLDNVYHYEKPEDFELPYVVWAEEGEESSFHANNTKEEQVISGSLDFYTETEFDSLVDDIQGALSEIENCSWVLSSVQYEDETKLIHYSWNWELI